MNNEEGLSLEEKRYLASLSLSESFKYTLSVCVVTIAILAFAIGMATITFNDEIAKYGKITQIMQGNKQVEIFIPNSGAGPISNESIVNIHSAFGGLQVASGLVATILIALLIWMYRRVRGDYKRLKELDKEYIKQSYLLNFEIQNPKGESREERILNQLMLVIPELKTLQRKTKKKGGITIPYIVNQNINNYDFDLTVNLGKKGKLIVKFFDEKVKFEDIKALVKPLKSIIVYRLICVAREFDDEFKKEEIETKLKQLDINFNIDLVQETEKGYSMIWID